MADRGSVPHLSSGSEIVSGSKDSSLVPPKSQVGKIHIEEGRGYNGGSVNEIGNIQKIKG